MAAPWAAGALVRIIGRLQGQDCITTFHLATNTVINDPPALAALLTALATAMLQCAVDELLPAVTSDYTLLSVDARQIHPAISDPVEVAAPGASVGIKGPTSVSFAASLVKWRSTRGGRRGHGKNFLPPPGEAFIENSILDQDVRDQIVQFVQCVLGKFRLPGATEPWEVGVFSPTINKQLIGGGFDNAFAPITEGIVEDRLAVMGSRKVGRGS